MNTRTLLIALALAGAGIGTAQAATTAPQGQPPASAAASTKPVVTARHATAARHATSAAHAAKVKQAAHTKPAARTRHATHAKARPTAMDRLHQRVAFAREAEQRRWIAAEVQSGRLDRTQAASLWDAAADLAREQVLLARRGQETADEALAISHRQDQLDWAIRRGEVAYAPLAQPTAG